MAFVPLFAKRMEGEGADDARRFAEEALAVLLWTLLGLSALAMAAMPALVFLLAAGFADEPEKFDLAVRYARIEFPYLLCMSLTALFSGVLNAMGRFAAPAAAPILLNVILIGAMTLAAAFAWPIGDTLAWGVFGAGFAQAALVAQQAAHFEMGFGIIRPQLHCLRKVIQRRCRALLLGQHQAQVIMGLGVIGPQLYRLGKMALGRFDVSLFHQGHP
jgi:putative peptidoglycan lipid II flippase